MRDKPSHETTVVVVDIPYGLTFQQLTTEPDLAYKGSIRSQLKWLSEEVTTEEECERVFRATVCLYVRQQGAIPFDQCLEQAFIWERG